MSNIFSKKLSDIVTKAKINSALDMLNKGNTEELAKRINNVDKQEFLEKLSSMDESSLKDLNIEIDDDLKQRISNCDFQEISNIIGTHGDEIVTELKRFLK